MKSIEQHIEKDRSDLAEAEYKDQKQKVRHLRDELYQLETYQKNHPDDHHDPTSLELFCDTHPSDSRCKIYED